MAPATASTRRAEAPAVGLRYNAQPMKLHARNVSRVLGLGLKTAGFLGAVTAHQHLVPAHEQGPLFQRYMKTWARTLVRSTGGQVLLTPESVLPPQRGPRMIVANHRSAFDVGVLLGLFGGQALSRADLKTWPLLGVAATKAGTIFVDREDARSGANAIRELRRRLEQGASILVFPEGTTHRGDEVQPFKAGVFTALRGLDVEIVPVGLAYDAGSEWVGESFLSHVLRLAQKPVTRCVVQIGTPRIVSRRTAELPEELRIEVQKLVIRARAYHEHTSHSSWAR